ncbi:hypothetical protein OHB54_22720 [Streptomyces sp. NBC_01007]|nr:hypothetical protein OHB54_22720 [Streptomyces sp. NBC_01007]
MTTTDRTAPAVPQGAAVTDAFEKGVPGTRLEHGPREWPRTRCTGRRPKTAPSAGSAAPARGSYRDATAERGVTYYWVTAVHADGTESVPGAGDAVLAP